MTHSPEHLSQNIQAPGCQQKKDWRLRAWPSWRNYTWPIKTLAEKLTEGWMKIHLGAESDASSLLRCKILTGDFWGVWFVCLFVLYLFCSCLSLQSWNLSSNTLFRSFIWIIRHLRKTNKNITWFVSHICSLFLRKKEVESQLVCNERRWTGTSLNKLPAEILAEQ